MARRVVVFHCESTAGSLFYSGLGVGFFLESTFKDQINPKRQTAGGPHEGGSPEVPVETRSRHSTRAVTSMLGWLPASSCQATGTWANRIGAEARASESAGLGPLRLRLGLNHDVRWPLPFPTTVTLGASGP